MYLHLLLLCAIFSQGIIGTFADEDIRNSSAIVVRQKRVINRIPGEDEKVPIHKVRYIVIIKQFMRMKCVGTILSRHVVITIPSCVDSHPSQYQVFSGSSRTSRGDLHNVTEIRRHMDNHLPNRNMDGIALLTVNTPFVNPTYARPINLHTGPLLPNTNATVSGWGYACGTNNHGTQFPLELRSIKVPIMPHRECVNRYRPHNIVITDKDICTFHPQKHCGHNDAGAPLVVDGHLAGIHRWTGAFGEQFNPHFPDVFAILQDLAYVQWITSNVQNIEAHIP